jgi:hypothetical protein
MDDGHFRGLSNRPAHDAASMQVEHRGGEILTTSGPDVGDITTLDWVTEHQILASTD